MSHLSYNFFMLRKLLERGSLDSSISCTLYPIEKEAFILDVLSL